MKYSNKMKTSRKHIFAPLAILAAAVLTFSCMEIVDIIFPANPQVDSEIEITVITKLTTETDETTKMIFAALFPKSWKVTETISATLTTSGYASQGYAEVVDQPMKLVNSTDVELTTQLPWVQAYQSKIGFMENKGDVEWIVFESKDEFIINDKISTDPITGTVKIKVKTGSDNIKYFFAAGFCSKKSGFGGNDGRYKANETAKVLSVTGGSGVAYDYTVLPLVSTVPGTFRYGDIFSICFESMVEDEATALYETEEIYLCGTVTLSDGSTRSVDTTSGANLMKKKGEVSYYRYIYPMQFFNVPDGLSITDMNVYFTNKDRTVIVYKDNDTKEMFPIAQAAE